MSQPATGQSFILGAALAANFAIRRIETANRASIGINFIPKIIWYRNKLWHDGR